MSEMYEVEALIESRMRSYVELIPNAVTSSRAAARD
jgi:hypothetical protein